MCIVGDWARVGPAALLIAYIVRPASRRGGRKTSRPVEELPGNPTAAQMERPRWVCAQDGGHNGAILLGGVITGKEDMTGERGAGAGLGCYSRPSRC